VVTPDKPPVKRPPKRKKTKAWKALGWVFSGLTAASLGTAIYFTVALKKDAQRYDDWLKQECPNKICKISKDDYNSDPTVRDIKDDGKSHALWANVTWIGAGVTGAAAVTFFLVDAFATNPSKTAHMPRVQPIIAPGFTGLTFNLGF